MALQIIWTEHALEDYKRVVDYLGEEWSFEVAEKFTVDVQSRLTTLSNYPFLGIVSRKQPSIRSISLGKLNRLYYRIALSSIEVLSIFDTRQNPDRNKFD